jgi:hypothetical protein
MVTEVSSVARYLGGRPAAEIGPWFMTAEGVAMRITRAADWVLFSTSHFDEQVAYMRDVLGMSIESQGPAVVDKHFLRYVLFALPGGVTLEVVEPSPDFADFHDITIVCFTVDDLSEGLRELAARQQTPISPVFTHGRGWGWTYLQMPDGGIYQLQGSVP